VALATSVDILECLRMTVHGFNPVGFFKNTFQNGTNVAMCLEIMLKHDDASMAWCATVHTLKVLLLLLLLLFGF